MIKNEVVVICSWYNRPDYIDKTVNSLLCQTFNDYSILIINDGSPDPKVKQELDRYDDDRLVIVHQENLGFVDTINKYIEMVSSKYVCIMGAGDTAESEKIRAQYDYMQKNDRVVAVGCGHNLISAGTDNKLGYCPPLETVTEDDLKNKVPFTHGTVMYRAEALRAAGLYDPFFKYCQDWDLYARLLKFGEIRAINRPLYNKYVFSDGFTFSPRHNIAQVFFSELAKSQDRERIDEYKKNGRLLANRLNEASPRNMPLVCKRILRLSMMREWALVRSWLVLLKKQVLSLF